MTVKGGDGHYMWSIRGMLLVTKETFYFCLCCVTGTGKSMPRSELQLRCLIQLSGSTCSCKDVVIDKPDWLSETAALHNEAASWLQKRISWTLTNKNSPADICKCIIGWSFDTHVYAFESTDDTWSAGRKLAVRN